MFKGLRAFMWLRWRVFVNSLERTGARSALDRFSIAIEKIGPIIAVVLLVPSGIGLFILSIVAGFGIGTGSWLIPFQFVRFFLLFATVMAFFAPIVLSARSGSNVVRLLLLPIPRRVLYVSHVAGSLADPWILLLVPVTVGVPVGLAIGVRPLAALLALATGVGMILFVTAATSLVSSIVELLFRDRRRADAVMLILAVVLPLMGLLPTVLQAPRRSEGQGDASSGYSRRKGEHKEAPAFIQLGVRVGELVAPSELYQRATLQGTQEPARALPPLVGLAAGALLFQAAAYAAFTRMLDMPITVGARRARALRGLWQRTIPGLTPGVSAVALAHLRLALRSPRGRQIIAGPLLIVGAGVFIALYRRGALPIEAFQSNAALTLAAFGVFVSIAANLPLWMNQFAVDRAGFTRQMLSPLTIGELLAGKAIGNFFIAAIPGTASVLIPAVLLHSGEPAIWLSLPLATIATFALIAPLAAVLSAIFPRTVDLSSIGSRSNAHQAAALMGLLAIVVSGAPALGIVLLATYWFGQPFLAPVLMAIWCAVAIGISRVMFMPVRQLVASRAEGISQY